VPQAGRYRRAPVAKLPIKHDFEAGKSTCTTVQQAARLVENGPGRYRRFLAMNQWLIDIVIHLLPFSASPFHHTGQTPAVKALACRSCFSDRYVIS
jgi:hypothetical protein